MDLDIRLRGAYHVGDPEIWLGGPISYVFSNSHLFHGWREPKSIAKLDGGHGRISPPLDPPLSVALSTQISEFTVE